MTDRFFLKGIKHSFISNKKITRFLMYHLKTILREKTKKIMIVNVFILSIYLALIASDKKVDRIPATPSIGIQFPTSYNDIRLLDLQKQISFEKRFSSDIMDGIKEFTNLAYKEAQSLLEKEGQYITGYLKDKLDNYKKDLINVVKANSSSPGYSVAIIEQFIPAINNNFDIVMNAYVNTNANIPEDPTTKTTAPLSFQGSLKQDQPPQVVGSNMITAQNQELLKQFDESFNQSMSKTLDGLKKLNGKILQKEPTTSENGKGRKTVEDFNASLDGLVEKFLEEFKNYMDTEYLYIKEELTKQQSLLLSQIRSTVNKNVTNLIAAYIESQREFTSSGKIRFYFPDDGADITEAFTSKGFTPWYDFTSSGVISIYDIQKAIAAFLNELHQSGKYDLTSFTGDYTYFESKGDISLENSTKEEHTFASFGYIAFKVSQPASNPPASADKNTSAQKSSFLFHSLGYIAYLTDTQNVSSAPSSDDVIWHAFTSSGQFDDFH